MKAALCHVCGVEGPGSGRVLRAWLISAPHAWGPARRPRRGTWGAGKVNSLPCPVVGTVWEDLAPPRGLAAWLLGVCTPWCWVPRVREPGASSPTGCGCGCAVRPGLGSLAHVERDVKPGGGGRSPADLGALAGSWSRTGCGSHAPPAHAPRCLECPACLTGSALADVSFSILLLQPELYGNLCAHVSCSKICAYVSFVLKSTCASSVLV